MLDPALEAALAAEFQEYQGEGTLSKCRVDKQKAHALLLRLADTEGPARASELMDRLKDALMELQGETSPGVQVVRIKRPRARITVDIFADIKIHSALEKQFHFELEKGLGDSLRLAGLIMFSAINHGGLLAKSGPELLLVELAAERIKSKSEQVWFELPFEGAATPQRWVPDGITTLLVERFLTQGNAENLRGWISDFGANKWLMLLRQSSLAKLTGPRLLKVSAAKSALYCSPALVDCAIGINASRPLSEASYLRGITRTAPVVESVGPQPGPSRPRFKAHRKQQGVDGKSDEALLLAVGQQLRASSDLKLKSLREDIDELISSYEADCTHITILLSRWVASRLTSKNRWGNRFKPKSGYTRLRSIARRLRSELGPQDPTQLSPAALIDAYEEVVDDAGTLSLSNTLRRNLRDFHEYLEDEYGVESLDGDAPWSCLGSSHAEVDANILWPHEYDVAANYYRTKLEQVSEDEFDVYQARYLALVLGYRCGLRRREVLYLRLADIHLQGAHPEILVRPHSERDLKSTSGNRRVPISVLLTEDEKNALISRVERLKGSDYLFSQSGGGVALINHKRIFDHVTWLLQQVTGNVNARFHQLRHSFATLALHRWLEPVQEPASPFHDPSVDVAQQRRVVLALADGLEPSPKVLHAIAMMIGHSGPALTLEHYIHCAQDVRALQHSKGLPVLSSDALVQLTGVGVRQLQKIKPRTSLFESAVLRAKKRLKKVSHICDTEGWIRKSADEIGDCDREVGGQRVDLFDYWQAILVIGSQGYTYSEAARRFHLDDTLLRVLCTKAKRITQMRYRSGAKNLRHRTGFWTLGDEDQQQIFFNFPTKQKDMSCLESMLEHYLALNEWNRKVVDQAVDYFLAHGSSRNTAIPFKEPKSLEGFIEAYRLLGFNPVEHNGSSIDQFALILTATDASPAHGVFDSAHWAFWAKHIPTSCVFQYEMPKPSMAAPNGEIGFRVLNEKSPVSVAKFEHQNIERVASWGFRLGLYILALQRELDACSS